MTKLRAFWLRWKLGVTPEDHLIDDYEVLIRCARRCAYDLSHAASCISARSDFGIDWEGRARHWTQLFAKGNPAKDYRLRMHADLEEAQRVALELFDLVQKNGLINQVSPRTQNARCLMPF